MDRQFDELTKSVAAGVPRREVLRRLAWGLPALLLSSLGLGSQAPADAKRKPPQACGPLSESSCQGFDVGDVCFSDTIGTCRTDPGSGSADCFCASRGRPRRGDRTPQGP